MYTTLRNQGMPAHFWMHEQDTYHGKDGKSILLWWCLWRRNLLYYLLYSYPWTANVDILYYCQS
jgi:hypothetical protein